MTPTSRPPSPAILTAYDCWGLLETEEVARIAWASPAGAAIAPVNYTVVDGCLWFRTQPDSALGRQCTGERIAVEIDHVDREARTGWSVVVVGTAQRVEVEHVPDAVMELRVWPADARSLHVRVDPIQVTGRRL